MAKMTRLAAPLLAAGLLMLGACSKTEEAPASTAEATSTSEASSEVSSADGAVTEASTVTTETSNHTAGDTGGGSDNHNGSNATGH